MDDRSYREARRALCRIDPDHDCDALNTALLELGTETFDQSPILVVVRARSRAIDERRVRERLTPKYLAARCTFNPALTPYEEVTIAERRECIRAAVGDLDEPYRSVVCLRYWEGKSPRHIAKALGHPLHTIYTQLRRALSQLRRNSVLEQLDN